ncbi:MAG: S-methyl-5'-thioadenosine phosphorylase [Candidatus Omnitrophota bacterium]|nr:S-methyl-5'-thioadenosine phosphorylase [Candidatus Omnitrophota bacterium]
MARIGIIGGSGLYEMEGIKNVKSISVATPFGKPSDRLILGILERREVVFLARHGRGHRISPSDINFRANIFAMKKMGVGQILSVSACGSLKEEFKPLDFVVPNQFVDRTTKRQSTFFTDGIVAHIGFSEPICPQLSKILFEAGKKTGANIHFGGNYLNMEGPAFSTKAESELYRSWNMDIIGMTNLTEAKLAREAEICYATLAAVTDYDCWHPSHDSVTVEMIVQNLLKNVENAKKVLKLAINLIPKQTECSCQSALKYAIITNKKFIPAKIKKDLKIIIGKY